MAVQAHVVKSQYTPNQWAVRFGIAIFLDIIDVLIGWIPVIGFLLDIALTIAGYFLWGKTGLIEGWEILEWTNIIDISIPTLTIAGLIKYYMERREMKRANKAGYASAHTTAAKR
jgi:hypothetical protein